MRIVVLLRDGECIEKGDVLVGPNDLEGRWRKIAEAWVKSRVYDPIVVNRRYKISGHPRGYWVIRQAIQNEYGVVSP